MQNHETFSRGMWDRDQDRRVETGTGIHGEQEKVRGTSTPRHLECCLLAPHQMPPRELVPPPNAPAGRLLSLEAASGKRGDTTAPPARKSQRVSAVYAAGPLPPLATWWIRLQRSPRTHTYTHTHTHTHSQNAVIKPCVTAAARVGRSGGPGASLTLCYCTGLLLAWPMGCCAPVHRAVNPPASLA